ncbi:MAG TPA: ATP-binding protein [Nevskiaceae bacterium]|nr:ATP-binding protein [Nevskiaceae bacterium]
MIGTAIVAIICVINLLLGGMVLLRNPRQRVGIAFCFISLFVSLWAVSNYLTSTSLSSLAINDFFNRMAYFTAFFAVVFCLWFSVIFPMDTRTSKPARNLFVIVSLCIGLLSVTDFIAGTVTRTNGELHFSIGTMLPLYIAVIGVFLILIIRNLLRTFRRSRGKVRQQTLFIMAGFGLPIILGLTTNAILPSVTEDWATTALGPSSTVFLVGIISFAIVRHRLFDLRWAVARSFAYLLSIVALASFYAVTAFSFSTLLLDGTLTARQELFLALFSAIAALFFQPLKRFFDRVTNRLFYRDAYDSQIFIDELNRILVANVDLRELLTKSAKLIASNFKADFCLFGMERTSSGKEPLIIGSEDRTFSSEDIKLGQRVVPTIGASVIVADELSAEHDKLKNALYKNNVALLARLTTSSRGNGESLGYVILGTKKSGNPYNRQDINMLDIIANGLVIAIQNALRFEEIERFNETLQQKVDDATRKLRQTNDKLRTLNETKDDFIGMASHQLRTPLTSVKGYVSMVLDGDAGKINSLQRKLLNQSFISSQRMVYLIADLLNVSRLRTGKFVIEPTPTNLASVVKEEVEQLMETAKSRNLELTYHKPEHFPVLPLDDTKLRQVIMNFIDNAIYYTPSGGHITVSVADNPHSVELTVVDDGIGVPRAEQHHLFSKFFRAHNAKRARPDGTGLGLFMAKKVVVAQGGAVIFKSTEGKGSTFGFSFPKGKLLPPIKPKIDADAKK